MHARRLFKLAVVGLTAPLAMPALAQTTSAAGTVVVLPSVAAIPGAFATTVFVQNPNASSITLKVRYYQSDSNGQADAGTQVACANLTVGAGLSLNFDLASQCTFSGTNNFGMLVLEDITGTYKTNKFYAYSRAEAPTGNGFSVEGFPIGNFSGKASDTLGLKKTSTAPHYRSNCFIGALGEQVDYQIVLRQGETGATVGSAITGSLLPYHTVRYLDVFAGAGAGASSYSNVRAHITNSQNSAMVAFCTLETSDNLSADFRVAKSDDANDNRQSRLACYGMDSCGAASPSVSNPATLTSATSTNVHYAILDQPDFVKCDLVSPNASDLQIRLREPGNLLSAPVFTLPAGYNSAPYTAGGTNATTFYVYTGEKSTIASGTSTRWYIDVSLRPGGNAGNLPIDYGIKCASGNGISVPWLGTTVATSSLP